MKDTKRGFVDPTGPGSPRRSMSISCTDFGLKRTKALMNSFKFRRVQERTPRRVHKRTTHRTSAEHRSIVYRIFQNEQEKNIRRCSCLPSPTRGPRFASKALQQAALAPQLARPRQLSARPPPTSPLQAKLSKLADAAVAGLAPGLGMQVVVMRKGVCVADVAAGCLGPLDPRKVTTETRFRVLAISQVRLPPQRECASYVIKAQRVQMLGQHPSATAKLCRIA